MNHQRSSIFCFLSSGNVPLEPSKLFPLGKTFLWNRASFSCLGKCSSGTEQAFPAWENVPLEPSKLFPLGKTFPWNRASFSRPGKRSPGTGQAFPAWENVPLEPSKLFPPGKTFPWNRASFSRLGKCSPRAGFVRFAAVEGVCDTPLHIYHLLVGNAVKGGSIWCKYFATNCRGVSHTP